MTNFWTSASASRLIAHLPADRKAPAVSARAVGIGRHGDSVGRRFGHAGHMRPLRRRRAARSATPQFACLPTLLREYTKRNRATPYRMAPHFWGKSDPPCSHSRSVASELVVDANPAQIERGVDAVRIGNATPDTSAPQPWLRQADTSRLAVGLG
jgi:hypothetical protein